MAGGNPKKDKCINIINSNCEIIKYNLKCKNWVEIQK